MPKNSGKERYVNNSIFKNSDEKNELTEPLPKYHDSSIIFLSLTYQLSEIKYFVAYLAELNKKYNFLTVVYSDPTIEWHNFKTLEWRALEEKRRFHELNPQEIYYQNQLETEAKMRAKLDLIRWGRSSFWHLYLNVYSPSRSYQSFSKLTQFYENFLQQDILRNTEIVKPWDELILSYAETSIDRGFFLLLKAFITVSKIPSAQNMELIDHLFNKITNFLNKHCSYCELKPWQDWVNWGQQGLKADSIVEREWFYFSQPRIQEKLYSVALSRVEKIYTSDSVSMLEKNLYLLNSIDYLQAKAIKVLLQPRLLGYSSIICPVALKPLLDLIRVEFKEQSLFENLAIFHRDLGKSFEPQSRKITAPKLLIYPYASTKRKPKKHFLTPIEEEVETQEYENLSETTQSKKIHSENQLFISSQEALAGTSLRKN